MCTCFLVVGGLLLFGLHMIGSFVFSPSIPQLLGIKLLSGKNSCSFTFMVIAESEVFWVSSYIKPVLPGLASQSTILSLEVLLSFHLIFEPLLFIPPARYELV